MCVVAGSRGQAPEVRVIGADGKYIVPAVDGSGRDYTNAVPPVGRAKSPATAGHR